MMIDMIQSEFLGSGPFLSVSKAPNSALESDLKSSIFLINLFLFIVAN